MSGTVTLPDLAPFGAKLAGALDSRPAPSILGGPPGDLSLAEDDPAALLEGTVVDAAAARALNVGVLLWHDLDKRARPVLDGLATTEASYWQAVSYRKEGDTGSANYWWHRTGRHPVFEPLTEVAVSLLQGAEGPLGEFRDRIERRGWDTGNFVELTRRARENISGGAAWVPVLTEIQRAEIVFLLDHCARKALGR